MAAESVHALAPLQQAVNTCVQAITVNISGQANDAATSAALETLLGKKAADVIDVAKVTDDAANNTVQISYELQNGQVDNATFDAGRVIFALLGNIPGFALFGIVGDPAVYCTEAAFWYTGQLGGQIGHLLRAKLLPAATATASIQGTWVLTRSAPTVCANLPAGCHDSPIRIRFSHCTDSECVMSRTDGVWQSSHSIRRSGATWAAEFQDIAMSCGSHLKVAVVTINLTVTSTFMRNGTLSARSLGGTYAASGTLPPPDCKNPQGLESRAVYDMYGSRS